MWVAVVIEYEHLQLLINSLWLSDATWWHGSTLAQVMACCLRASSLYLNQCWLVIKGVLWCSPESIFTINTHELNSQHVSGNYIFEITTTSPRGQWVNQIGLLMRCGMTTDELKTIPLRNVENWNGPVQILGVFNLFNMLRPGKNSPYFADDIFECFFL